MMNRLRESKVEEVSGVRVGTALRAADNAINEVREISLERSS